MDLLLEHGADVDAERREADAGYSALALAASGPHPEIVAALLKAGAAVDPSAADSAPAIVCAASTGHVEATRALVRHKADVNRAFKGASALGCALARGGEALVTLLLDAGAKAVDAERGIDVLPQVCGAEWALPQLLERGGVPATYPVARCAASAAVMERLIARGCDVNAPNAQGQTPCVIAAARRDPGLLQLLLDKRADVHATGTFGPHTTSPLGVAASADHLPHMKLLLSADADVNAAPAGATPPVLVAAGAARVGALGLLPEANADVRREADTAVTRGNALFAAVDGCGQAPAAAFEATIRWLTPGKVEPDALCYGRTALYHAAAIGSAAAVAALLRAKADPNVACCPAPAPGDGAAAEGQRWTALEVAQARQHRDVVRVLQAHLAGQGC